MEWHDDADSNSFLSSYVLRYRIIMAVLEAVTTRPMGRIARLIGGITSTIPVSMRLTKTKLYRSQGMSCTILNVMQFRMCHCFGFFNYLN